MNPAELSAVNARHGIPEHVVIREGPGGLGIVDVKNPHATATVALQGAHLLQWRPDGAQDVIWLSGDARFTAGRSVRGGIPVCWPWFGPHPVQAEFPAHGFARTEPWELFQTDALENGATRLAFRLVQSDTVYKLWPHDSELELHMTIGAKLELGLLTRNTGTEAFTIGDALHTYFAVSDIAAISIEGLETCPYIDKMDNDRRKQQAGSITFAAETDRIYLDATSDCLINDPGMQRRIRISKKGSRSTVVWNPWIEKSERMGDMGRNGYRGMVCVESTNAADDVVNLLPGAEHRLAVCYRLEPLSGVDGSGIDYPV